MTFFRRNRGRRGVSLLLGTTALIFIVPMVGLVIDVGVLYAAKARLQAAVDGASLAAARALTLGQSVQAQASAAQQNAVNWFYANFPSGNWATTNTIMNSGTVVVTAPANIRTVSVTATTTVPTWFMRWFHLNSTTITANGTASRRDVVAMLVLDRSGSMCSINGATASPPCGEGDGTPCDTMIQKAKLFTGSFAAGRDQIGLLTFSDGAYRESAPTTSFQTVLGYSNSSGSANGVLDNIQCNGGTGTAQAISLAYNELYKMALPGALNVIVLETDGLPNTLVYNFWDGTGSSIDSSSGCLDANGKTAAGGGWKTAASMRDWNGTGYNMNNGGTGFMSNIPSGAIGAFYTSDPAQGSYQIVLFNPWQTGDSSNNNSITSSNANGCNFSGGTSTDYSDFDWLPKQDVYGNLVKPTNAYKSVTVTGNHIALSGPSCSRGNCTSPDWTNTHGAALNATDNAAYNARANATLPVTMFVIGLGGNEGNPPDAILLQRMANDPNGDLYNNPATYQPCAQETGCITYSSQPQGTFVYAQNSASLGSAFQAIASQILRLSH